MTRVLSSCGGCGRPSLLLACVLTSLWQTPVTPVSHSHRPADMRTLWEDPPPAPSSCTLYDQTSCGGQQCCVKEVISFLDLDKLPVVRTRCQPHRVEGELCLRQPEGYLCDCAKGLVCRYIHNETYGHCGSD